jgi:hypothetical protein
MIDKLQNHDRQLHFDVRNIERIKSKEPAFVKPIMWPKPSPEEFTYKASLGHVLKNCGLLVETYGKDHWREE